MRFACDAPIGCNIGRLMQAVNSCWLKFDVCLSKLFVGQYGCIMSPALNPARV